MNHNRQNYFRPGAGRQAVRSCRSDGFYGCSHCHEEITPTAAQVELAENAPDPDPALKCPHCHKYTVHWQMPFSSGARIRPRAVSAEHGRELFAGIFQMLAKI